VHCRLALFALLACVAKPVWPAEATLPHVSAGRIERLADMASRHVPPRNVDIWLPPKYPADAPYAVVYMHDGQMLFDPTTTWNKQAWRVDAVLDRLMREGRVADTIVVGVWNNGKYRAAEYYPQKFLDRLPAAARDSYVAQAQQGRSLADNYLRFLVTELKPAIDQRYATRSDASGTFIMGSSMGGLISVYAYAEYPQVFGGAAGLSTHWVGTHTANASFPLAAFGYLSQSLPAPQGRRLYLDRGTATLDALYGPAQTFVDQIVRDAGYDDQHFMSRVFEGAEHTETAWSQRLELPLLFLLGQPRP